MPTDSTSGSRAPARPSSSTSDGLFDGIYARGDVAAAVGGRAWLQAMLDVEGALARACAREGLIPDDAAEAIAAACRAGDFDLAALARETADHASPVVPLVRALREAVGGDTAEHVHHGATSQDVVDTAAMLVARRALDPLLRDSRAAMDAAARLADRHRATPVMGRTLLQQAVPMSFGLKAAVWLNAVADAAAWVADTRTRALAVQMGGPVGARSPAVAAHVARDLDLADPVMPWHTNRARPAGLASSLGALAGAFAKVAQDVVLMSQTEVGELREGVAGRGESSAMPHKRNPVAAVSVIACTERVPALVGAVFAAMPQEHERAAGRWQSEWGTMTDLMTLTGSAAAWSADLLGHLEVDAERMRANLGGADPDPGAADELIDRALGAYRA
jgi:3-carboxy-cis,cis-muconate cycloisomerase